MNVLQRLASKDHIWAILLLQRECLQMSYQGASHASLCQPLDCHLDFKHHRCFLSPSRKQLASPAGESGSSEFLAENVKLPVGWRMEGLQHLGDARVSEQDIPESGGAGF